MSFNSDFEWLKTHPLSFEIVYALSLSDSSTPSKLAMKLNRGLSTISEGLTILSENTSLIVELGKLDERDRRKRLYSLRDRVGIKNILASDEMLRIYAKESSRLRKVPPILMEIFYDRLSSLLETYSPKRHVWVLSTLDFSTTGPTFMLKTSKGSVYLEIKRIRDNESKMIHESIGKIMDYKYGREEALKIVQVFLFTPVFKRSYEASILRLFENLNDEQIKIRTIVEFIDDASLLESFIIKSIANTIIDNIKKLVEDVRRNQPKHN